jgi:hypothetical protein
LQLSEYVDLAAYISSFAYVQDIATCVFLVPPLKGAVF